jgi:hypothetical protein
MRRWLLGGIGVLLLVTLFFLWIRSSRPKRPINDELRMAEDKPSVPVGRKSMPATPERLVSPIASARPNISRNEYQPNDLQLTRAYFELERLRPKLGGPVDALRRIYRTESSDETSRDTENLIRKQFGPWYLPTDSLRNVACHKSVCKIELFWSPRRPTTVSSLKSKLIPLLTAHVAIDPPSETDKEGGMVVEIYIVRPGHELLESLRNRLSNN